MAEAELCWNTEMRRPLPGSGKLPCLHMRRKASWGSEREGAPPTSLCARVLGRVLGQGRRGERSPMIGQR